MSDRAPRQNGATGVRRRATGRWALVGTVVLALLVSGTVAVVTMRGGDVVNEPDVEGERVPMAFGVLGSACDPARAAALHDAGVRFAEIEVDWAAFEPRPGEVDGTYGAELVESVDVCRRAGLGVILTPGLHSAPAWVTDLPGGLYRDQAGEPGPADVPNVVFSTAVRQAVADHLAVLDRWLDLDSLAAVRVGTGHNGELGFPQSETAMPNAFWGFDLAAQRGTGLADGAEVSPMPGWKPGDPTWNGAAVSTDQVREWFDWYSASVAEAVLWVVRELRGLGFTRDVHLPLAGRGALPADLQRAVENRLDGTADRDGSLESGLFYPDQLRRIADSLAESEQPGWGTVSADSSSVDDATSVQARAQDPPQDHCRPEDLTTDLLTDPTVIEWPSHRWTVANARQAGLGVVGENPGSPNTPGTGGNDLTDSSEEQMIAAPEYAQECGMTLFQWAFEDDLFDRDQDGLQAYARRIRDLTRPSGRPSSASLRAGRWGQP